MKKLLLPIILAALVLGFWNSQDFQEIAAGVAIFLFGMLMLEDGFKQFSGGVLERVLDKSTDTIPKSLGFGFVAATVMQSSSLVSVITISFLSAGLIKLIAGIGIMFGADIGTTTGAWLVAGFGLKVKISAYAMPMLALSIVLVFQKSKYVRGFGFILAGLGFLFLGIHYMKEGFDAFSEQFDLTKFAMVGVMGLLVYTAIGSMATVVMQSSHATMVLVITAMAAGQVSYENAIALVIGANIGTTITAIIASLPANYLGRRLALAHVIFKLVTAVVALTLINQMVWAVDWISDKVGIRPDDYALKLAVFHTMFNTMGVAIMTPLMNQLIAFLERTIPEPELDISQPQYLSRAVESFPVSMEAAMRKEVKHLQDNATKLIAHGLNLHRHEIYAADDVAKTVEDSRAEVELDIDAKFEQRVKALYSAIFDFASRAGALNLPRDITDHIYGLRDSAQSTVHAVKAIKHLRHNVTEYTKYPQGTITDIYNGLRAEIARILIEINKLDRSDPDDRSMLWLDEERVQIERDRKNTTRMIEGLIRDGKIDAEEATSFMTDSGYAYEAMSDLIEAARVYYADTEDGMAEVERILMLEDEDIEELLSEVGDLENID
ncbi:Na/Pi cotransporter family protein [Aliiruegeria sabulilitoris]|uniref:Na/Pi cotransporter family protein n=1 Tax=Aliiruegeria sabulilitoris TaxID=1510458 RepID=UPI00082A23FD|nr:Na/Pi symporter [Aliiruegeria sabulilitoris]NDR57936.1 Na/Pi cotransporter family protein [Pseudoruegeria sp. M32A2M]